MDNGEVPKRDEIRSAIAKAVELRALHAALVQRNNKPANLRSSTSPVSLSAQDYPVFTPSYEDEAVPNYPKIIPKSRRSSGNWEIYDLGGGGFNDTMLSDHKNSSSSTKGLTCGSRNSGSHKFRPAAAADDQISGNGSSTNHITVLQTSPGFEYFKSRRRNSLEDINSLSSCNNYKSATQTFTKNVNSKIAVPLTDSRAQHQPKTKRTMGISRFFNKLKKKNNQEWSPNMPEFEDSRVLSIERQKRELMEANESRDAALLETAEMKSSIRELNAKLEYLESHCEELRKELSDFRVPEKLENFQSKFKSKSMDGNWGNLIPIREEAMVESFLQVVSESRLSVKQFCKTLINQIEETDSTMIDNIDSLLQPYKLSLTSKYSKSVSYHLEAIINQTIYQDFENCAFQNNGTPKFLDPIQERQARFASFVVLRNLSWNEVVTNGTKHYSEEFSKFCDQKMSCIINRLNWTRPWSEKLLQSFFVGAKTVWLLHLLAFCFDPALGVLRVEENRSFDGQYMEDVFMDRQRSKGPGRVKVMVMPGFYVHDRVLRCKVVCRYKSVA